MSNTDNTKISIGTHGYYTSGSDRYPCTVVEVSESGHRVVVEQDDYTVVEGSIYEGNAKYEFIRRKGGVSLTFTRRKDGKYRLEGDSYNILVLGEWGAHYDPHF